eukprot:357826-Chlamydomonas_euryale.AAC.9
MMPHCTNAILVGRVVWEQVVRVFVKVAVCITCNCIITSLVYDLPVRVSERVHDASSSRCFSGPVGNHHKSIPLALALGSVATRFRTMFMADCGAVGSELGWITCGSSPFSDSSSSSSRR